jgi:hypothetical protein
MKKLLCGLAFTLFFGALNAQETNRYKKTDSIVKRLGSLDSFNVAIIADTVTRPFASKVDKARAIFYWITHNISYDLKAMRSGDDKKSDPVLVIQTRKANAGGYAKLFQEMCSMANVRCLTVDGYVKTSADDINNPAAEINHTWNVLQLGQSPEEWYYIDAARASGYADKKLSTFTKEFTSGFFFADRTLFNLAYFPDNKAWQLGSGPKNLKDFYALPVFSNTAFTYGLQKPQPSAGLIKSKTKNTTSFTIPYSGSVPITTLSIVMGEDKKPTKPEAINFSDNNGVISFNYQFKQYDSYPVKILADGKVLLHYYAEIKE